MSAVSVNIHIEDDDVIHVERIGRTGFVYVTDAAIHVHSVETIDRLIAAFTELRARIEERIAL